MPRHDQPRGGVEGDIEVGILGPVRVRGIHPPLLLPYERPDLIDLQMAHVEVPEAGAQQGGGALADLGQPGRGRVPLDAGDGGSRRHGIARASSSATRADFSRDV
ncbi:MAG: hypothetical protein F4173_19255 [Acidobacteriia bacterium]|nr:hypothetical protein [Terriglobia bacterium]